MSDMADFALDQVCEEEIYRAEAYWAGPFSALDLDFQENCGFSPQAPIKELDVDCLDPDRDFQFASIDFDSLTKSSVVGTNLVHTSEISKFRGMCAKYSKKWQMIMGMAKTVWLYKKPLSDKQIAWMDKNYKGGSGRFISDLTSKVDGDKLMWLIIKFATFVKAFGEGDSLEKSVALANYSAHKVVKFKIV